MTTKLVHSFKLLGVMLNDHLTWDDHIQLICRVARQINLLRHLPWLLPLKNLKTFYYQYIMPQFDYCDTVWMSSPKHLTSKLEKLQNYACCIMFNVVYACTPFKNWINKIQVSVGPCQKMY